MQSSRYHRPAEPAGVVLTDRDLRTIEAVHHYRLLTARHVARLVFPGVAYRTTQDRLRRLWATGYLDRLFPVGVVDGRPGTRLNLGEPTYTATKKGGRAVGAEPGRHARLRPSLDTLQHHLVAVDLETAVVAAPSGPRASALSEGELRALVRSSPAGVPRLVPDGALTLEYGTAEPQTFLIEVVRAGVKAGNATLARKMETYRERVRTDWFLRTYGFAAVRAVVIVTPTASRADHYRALAERITPGRGLFWFAAYEAMPSLGPPVTHFAPETILDLPFTDGAGRTYSFRNPFIPHV